MLFNSLPSLWTCTCFDSNFSHSDFHLFVYLSRKKFSYTCRRFRRASRNVVRIFTTHFINFHQADAAKPRPKSNLTNSWASHEFCQRHIWCAPVSALPHIIWLGTYVYVYTMHTSLAFWDIVFAVILLFCITLLQQMELQLPARCMLRPRWH